jgi:putative heme-binding domain-containing protein
MKILPLILLSLALAWRAAAAEADMSKLSKDDLVKWLAHENSWQRRQAERLLGQKLTAQDAAVIEKLAALVANPAAAVSARLAALGVLHASGTLTEKALDAAARDHLAEIRTASARFTAERHGPNASALTRLEKLSADAEPTVRAAVATALRQFVSGSLTVNTAPRATVETRKLLPHLKELLARPSVEGDFYYPHIVWMAMEPRVAQDPTPFFPLLAANDTSVSAYATRRVMRRISDMADANAREKHLNAAIQWLSENADKTQLASAALDGLLEATKSRGAPPSINLEPVFAKLSSNPALAEKAQRLAAAYGDKSAARLLMAKINDPKASLDERLKGITAARETKTDGARDELLKLIRSPHGGTSSASPQLTSSATSQLKSEAVRAVLALGYDNAYAVVVAWPQLPPMTRIAAAEALVRGTKTGRALLAGIERKMVPPTDISATARRALANSEDATIADHADKLLGKYRKPGADKLKLIAEKRAVVLNGEANLDNGRDVAKRTCFVCHKLYNEGTDIGPDLTGVGRSTLDALLHNIIDPNEVIGNGFETTEVETKDGTTYTGRVVEESDTRIKLVNAGPVEHVIARSDIAVANGKPKITKKELSLMPEGLEQISNNDFRDLVMFLLNPPEDQRPWTPALRKELLGEEQAGRKAAAR